MATGFKIGGEGDLDQLYVSIGEMQALQDSGLLTLPIYSQYGERSIWTWGANGSGQMGIAHTSNVSTPVRVGLLTNWKSVTITGGASSAIKTDGTLWVWGYNASGQLGLGDTTHRSSPVQVGALAQWANVSAGTNHTLALTRDGTLWVWGYNASGQLGLGDTTHRSSPVQVGALSDWSSVSGNWASALAIKTDGTLWAWGSNSSGQLGLGDTTHRSSPVQVGALSDWKQVYCGKTQETLAIKTDGSLWAWGDNTYGQLGLGDDTSRSSPVRVGALTNWRRVFDCLSLKTDGSLWAWGDNTYGQLGLGDTVSRSSPVQVGALTNWRIAIRSTAAGEPYSLATRTDGTLWAWGSNSYGQLGFSGPSLSSPVQVGFSTDWFAPYLRQS
jgi:alpha-tubulin suppressor-like RCC1 family protein